jgi:hypothetical protein
MAEIGPAKKIWLQEMLKLAFIPRAEARKEFVLLAAATGVDAAGFFRLC